MKIHDVVIDPEDRAAIDDSRALDCALAGFSRKLNGSVGVEGPTEIVEHVWPALDIADRFVSRRNERGQIDAVRGLLA